MAYLLTNDRRNNKYQEEGEFEPGIY
jgi:hypothetical protein